MDRIRVLLVIIVIALVAALLLCFVGNLPNHPRPLSLTAYTPLDSPPCGLRTLDTTEFTVGDETFVLDVTGTESNRHRPLFILRLFLVDGSDARIWPQSALIESEAGAMPVEYHDAEGVGSHAVYMDEGGYLRIQFDYYPERAPVAETHFNMTVQLDTYRAIGPWTVHAESVAATLSFVLDFSACQGPPSS